MKTHTLGADPLLTLPVNGMNNDNDNDNDYSGAPPAREARAWTEPHS